MKVSCYIPMIKKGIRLHYRFSANRYFHRPMISLWSSFYRHSSNPCLFLCIFYILCMYIMHKRGL
uniref:Uncharacterized protein n=1 Tax=Glossina palpalis gambiensis TaxID=67801 RepID=A0A1B0BIN4_9MUSC